MLVVLDHIVDGQPGTIGSLKETKLKTKRHSLLLVVLATLTPLCLFAGEEESWDINDPHAPTDTLEFITTEGTWMNVDVSPDGATIAFDLLGHLYEMPVTGGEATRLTEGRSWNMHPRYGPEGNRIAFTSDRSGSDDVWMLDRESGELTNVSEKPLPVFRPTWSTDGRQLFATMLDTGARGSLHAYDFHGGSQELHKGSVFSPMGQLVDDARRGRIYFEQNDGQLYASGPRVKVLDKSNGEVEVFIDRSGGAFNPILSPDGSRLAYLNRADQQTALLVEELETRNARIVSRSIDRDRLEYRAYFYEIYPNMAWHPNGREVFVAYGGTIHAIDVDSGTDRALEIRVPVERALNRTIRFQIPIPDDETTTRLHRWGSRTDRGVLFEVLGDLWLFDGGKSRRITDTPAHETSPVYDPATRRIYYASWTDNELGSVGSIGLDGSTPKKLTSRSSQYGSLALAPEGGALAYLRGRGSLLNGALIESQAEFDLVLRDAEGLESTVTQVDWTANFPVKHPPTVMFDPGGEHLLFTEIEVEGEGPAATETLTLKRIRFDGMDETPLYAFPHAVRAVPSPDLKWIAFREYHRSFVTPYAFVGKLVTVSAMDGTGTAMRVDDTDGIFMTWSAGSKSLEWTRGTGFYEKSVKAIVAEAGDGEDDEPVAADRTELAVTFDVAAPDGKLALTGARILTMNADEPVLEDATVVVDGARIVAVGRDVRVPRGAKVIDVSGHTIMPGMVDSHAHPATDMSSLHVIEQRSFGLHASLAHGVTTVYELYGNPGHKDIWLSDMIRAGMVTGPRVFTVGPPIYGLREFRPKLYRGIDSYEQALEHVRYNRDHGATAVKDYVHFTRAARHQLATASRELGLNIVAETAGNPPMNLTQVIDGETGLEHSMGLTPLYDDVVRLLAATKVGITPTLLVVYNGPGGQSLFNMNERVWENEKLLRFARADRLVASRRPTHFFPDDLYAPEMGAQHKKLQQAGVSIQMGGHGQMLGLDAHWELELLVQGGFTPLEALGIATINGAHYHGLDESVGSIEEGKFADLVVLTDNPLDDIRNTRSIRYVVKHGVVYAGDDLARVHPDPQPAEPMYFIEEK